MSSVPTVTRNLIIINVIVFIATLINENFMVATFAMFYPASQYFHVWQILTHMFMHGGFWHILFNMYTLWMFGSVLERMIGEKKFLIFYFVCGLGAVALHTGVEYLQDVKDKAIDRITIQLTTDLLNDEIVADLGEIVSEHPGKTKLFFQLRDSLGKHHVLLRSNNIGVDVRHQLIDYIERNEALDYKIN